ncbi:MAG: methyl-accepting chemotaxis protein [Alphaproteobacteria bacterium]|nr:methyl-accepting chemotaxis protein [Alphaproteobacteria bacterium]
MRTNLPVTEMEVRLEEDAILVSGTDTGGRITFANDAFVDIAGFSREDLIGAPHNIVRHPDMPQVAFADLWATLKRGQPWEGLVKNRTAAGDFYWVYANTTPAIEDGKITGYISIRSCPTRAQIADAEAIYARLGKPNSGLRLTEGRVERTGVRGVVDAWWQSLTGRLWMLLALALPGLLLAATALPAMAVALIGAALAGCLVMVAARGVALPVARLEAVCEAMATGDLTRRIPGEPTREFRRVTALLRATRARIAYADQERRNAAAETDRVRRRTLRDVATGLEDSLRGIIGAVGDAADRIETISNRSAQAQTAGSSRSLAVAESAETTLLRVSDLSAAGEELAASISEIGRQSEQAAGAAQHAVQEVDQSGSQFGRLSAAVSEIGDVALVIAEIAEQTNLLALNASIEAARAGEAGKGFAVVAGEVKALASQTARATEQIARQIQEVRDQTAGAVKVMERIGVGISGIEAMVSGIAGAVEEQRAVTSEIARAIAEVTQQMDQVASTIGMVGRGSVESCAGSIEMLWAVEALSDVARALADDVAEQLEQVRRQAA